MKKERLDGDDECVYINFEIGYKQRTHEKGIGREKNASNCLLPVELV